MAKKGNSKTGGKPKKMQQHYSDISEDEIERSMKEREKILLEDASDFEGQSDFSEEALMDLPSDEEEEEEYSEGDVLYAGEESDAGKEDKWGRSKKAFYSADGDALEEEAAEAKRLQKKRLGAMKADDFTGGKKLGASKKSSSGPVTLDLSSEEEEEEDASFDEEDEEEEEEAFELSPDQVATLSDEEKEALLAQHSADFAALLKDFKERLAHLQGTLQPLMATLKGMPTSEGLSFLQVKYQLLTAYCTNVAFYMRLKFAGQPVDSHPVLTKLVRFRLLLEKLRPLEQKLRYQVDRLLKAAAGQVDAADEDTRFKPNPDALLPAGAEDGDSDGTGADGVYRAPKITPMHFPEADDAAARKAKHEAYLRKVNASSRLIQDIRAEFDDAPEEEALDVVHGRRRGGKDDTAERERYEEDNYMRFTLDKKAKRKLEQRNKVVDELEDLNDFIGELGGGKTKGNKRSHREVQPAIPVASAKPNRRAATLDDESDIEDDFYSQVKRAKQDKKSSKQSKPQIPVKFRSAVDMQDGQGSRPANWKILKNKGLTPNRPKETKNPRVRQRMKFERAEKRLGSFRSVNKTAGGKYAGEGSGIRTNLVRSTKF